MPGILAMASRGAEGASGSREGESKKRSFDGKLVNGERNTPRTDAPAGEPAANGAVSAPSVNGISMPVSTAAMPVADQMAQLPPELEQLSSEHYHPLGKLMLRIAQECFNDLTEVLQKMADLPSNLQANGGMTNGHSMANGGQDNTELSKQKKLLLLQFAQMNRAKFIKLQVLAMWGKRASADVAKCIDLFMWEREQSTAMDSVDDTIHWLKMWSAHARQSNPDIRTALEILATKKAEWIPDLGYIPPETTSSEKALKLLRYMNTSLSIRLTVHEDLPRQMQKWRVESGRATFVVDGEFELDLLSFVEDTSEQWHFIDLRLLFSPAPNITLGSRFQFELKMQLDKILRENGLRMCFDYLHNFILTHKINVLRSQAYELVRTGWTGSLKVEPVHRGLVIQYWIDKAGKKNWIEIGISTNKPTNGKASWRGPPIPSLAVRWFRHGVEVKDANFNFDWNNVSMERMLKHVIARHIVHLLRTTQQNLNPAMAIKATFSETEPSECMLGASMGSANATTLSVEPVTGKYILQPITSLSSSAENIVNRPQEVSNTGTIITQLLARSIIDRIQRIAQQVGWQQIKRQSLRLDVMKAAVGLDVLQYVLYWPRGWTPTWALAAVVDASGETWWICEIGSTGSTVESARRIAIEKPEGHSPPINRTTLCGIGRIAVHTLAYHVTTRELEKRGKAFNLGDEFAQCRHHSASRGVVRGWVLHLKTADLLALKPDDPPWLEPGMRVMCQGLRSDSRNIWHIASGTMLPDAAADMKKLMSASPQKNFSFSEGGHFHILLCTPFGEEVVSELKARLRDLDRLRSFAATLQKRKMPLRSSSLQQVQFQYGQRLTATVKFDEGDDVKVHFSNNSPHKRIEGFLADMVNEKITATEHLPLDSTPGLDRFCTTLLVTRPVLSMLDVIANQQPGNYKNPAIHAHAIGTYRITYNNPICSFDIRLRPKEDKVFWLVEDNEGKPAEFRPRDERTPDFKRQETLKNALQKLYKESGERWYGVRSGIVADIDGIPGALKKLHETVLNCYVEGGVKQEPSNGGAPAGTTPGQPSNKGPGPKPSGGGAPNGKIPSGKINAVGGKLAVGVKREVITID